MLRKAIAGACLVVALVAGGRVYVLSELHAQPVPTATAPPEPTSFRSVAKEVLPAVVSIETRGKALAKNQGNVQHSRQFNGAQIPEEFRKLFGGLGAQPGGAWQFFDEFQNPLPQTPMHGLGSGFVIDPSGIVVTNYHVVKDADQVVVQLQDGRKFTSKDIKSDPKSDLAIVRIQVKETLPALSWGNSDAMEIGDRVLAVGNPYGLSGSMSAGIVSGKGRTLAINAYEDFLQTDAAINPGNSGGPLVNLKGQVIGIDTAIKSESGGSQGIGLAIASNAAQRIVDQLIHQGVVHRGYVGMQIRTLAPDVATRLGVPNGAGVLVGDVMKDSPAAKAGIKAGDVVIAAAGKTMKDARDLQRFAAAQEIGKSVQLTVFRDGHANKLNVMVAEQPAATRTTTPAVSQSAEEKGNTRMDRLGISVADLTPARAKEWGYSAKTGAVVTGVDDNSLAADAGLVPGALLLQVDKKPVHTASEAVQALDSGSLAKGILLQARTPQRGMEYIMLQESSGQ